MLLTITILLVSIIAPILLFVQIDEVKLRVDLLTFRDENSEVKETVVYKHTLIEITPEFLAAYPGYNPKYMFDTESVDGVKLYKLTQQLGENSFQLTADLAQIGIIVKNSSSTELPMTAVAYLYNKYPSR